MSEPKKDEPKKSVAAGAQDLGRKQQALSAAKEAQIRDVLASKFSSLVEGCTIDELEEELRTRGLPIRPAERTA